jgi:sulfur-oxidizing protein SoxA
MKKIVLTAALLASAALMAADSSQFSMSAADRAMYEEMLENNPADIFVDEGGELFDELITEEDMAKFLGVDKKDLPKYIAGFPRYVEKLDMVAGLDQVMQAIMADHGKEPFKLKSKKMFSMLAYAKSLANDEKINLDINANEHIKAAYKLGEEVYNTPRGGRGLACLSCHSEATIGLALRTQILPNLGEVNAAGTWPAYRMTKSSLRTLQRRFQGCMKNALMAVIPIGSKEMVALEVYVTNMAQGKPIAIPGLKR